MKFWNIWGWLEMKKHKEPIYTVQDLAQMQAFPLNRKIQIAQTRIIE